MPTTKVEKTMTIEEKFEKLKKAAQADVRAVRNRRTFNGGYWEPGTNINGPLLKEDVSTADTLGYETHMRIVGGKLTIFYVAKMPTAPMDVEYA
jgi:hypothetical protein